MWADAKRLKKADTPMLCKRNTCSRAPPTSLAAKDCLTKSLLCSVFHRVKSFQHVRTHTARSRRRLFLPGDSAIGVERATWPPLGLLTPRRPPALPDQEPQGCQPGCCLAGAGLLVGAGAATTGSLPFLSFVAAGAGSGSLTGALACSKQPKAPGECCSSRELALAALPCTATQAIAALAEGLQ